jgi:hypothetical protein
MERPRTLPQYVPLAANDINSGTGSLVKLNQSEEFKVDQQLHNYFKNLDDYLLTGQHPDRINNVPPELDTQRERERIASDRIYNPKSPNSPHVPGIDYLAKHKADQFKKATQKPNIYEMETFNVPDIKYQTPTNYFQNIDTPV